MFFRTSVSWLLCLDKIMPFSLFFIVISISITMALLPFFPFPLFFLRIILHILPHIVYDMFKGDAESPSPLTLTRQVIGIWGKKKPTQLKPRIPDRQVSGWCQKRNASSLVWSLKSLRGTVNIGQRGSLSFLAIPKIWGKIGLAVPPVLSASAQEKDIWEIVGLWCLHVFTPCHRCLLLFYVLGNIGWNAQSLLS